MSADDAMPPQLGLGLGPEPDPRPPAPPRARQAPRRRPRVDQLGVGQAALPRALEGLPGGALFASGPSWWLLQGDSLALLPQLPDGCVDLIFADPPYRLSNGGTTCRGGQRVAVDKGEWDESGGLASDHQWNLRWLGACERLLRPSGTLWVSGTQHVAFSLGFAMQALGFHLLNTVTWAKPNAPPLLNDRLLQFTTEILVWALPAEADPLPHVFHYAQAKEANGGRQLGDCWTDIPRPSDADKAEGVAEGAEPHPTQKPLRLLERIVGLCTNPGQLVLDLFNGSGTTGVVATQLGRQYIGCDLSAGYLAQTARRLGRP